MKLLTVLAAALLSTSVHARVGLFSSNDVAVFDDKLEVPGENPLEHCEDPEDDILELESVDLDPNPPLPGKTLTVVAKGDLSEDVEDGATVRLQVKYGLITIIKQTADLCKTVENVDLECPIEKGPIEFTKDIDLPKEIPPGKYSVIADVYTKDEKKITCLKATVEFKRGGVAGLFKQGL